MTRLASVCAVAVFGLLALGGRAAAEEKKPAKEEEKKPLKAEEFFGRIMEWNLNEKNLALTAAKNASREDVRKLAQRLADDHVMFEKALTDATKAAKVAISPVPDKEQRDRIAEIAKLKGDDFDKKFLAQVIESHEKELKWMDQTAKDTKEEQVRVCADLVAKTARKHLEEARDLQKKLGF
jgi:putative membrane protein